MFRLVNCPDPANYVTDGTDEVGNKTSVFFRKPNEWVPCEFTPFFCGGGGG